MSKKAMGNKPYKFTYQVKKGSGWVEVGRITYYLTDVENRRKCSNHNPKWVNE